jgi:hypothetical protein
VRTLDDDDDDDDAAAADDDDDAGSDADRVILPKSEDMMTSSSILFRKDFAKGCYACQPSLSAESLSFGPFPTPTSVRLRRRGTISLDRLSPSPTSVRLHSYTGGTMILEEESFLSVILETKIFSKKPLTCAVCCAVSTTRAA